MLNFSQFLILAKKNISITSTHTGPLFKLVFHYSVAGVTGQAPHEAIFYFKSADGKIGAEKLIGHHNQKQTF